MSSPLRKIKNIFKLILNSDYRFLYFANRVKYKRMDDSMFLSKKYQIIFHSSLNLDNPKTFNEKMQWLKLNNRNDVFTNMVDKYEVKKIVSSLIGDKYVIPLLGQGIYNSFKDIDFSTLPNKFVIKTTHDCGGVIVCRDKKELNIKKTKNIIHRSLKRNYYWHCREWPYKNCKPRILIEKYVKDEETDYLPVYKFLCFSGEPTIVQVIQNDKQINETIDYFDAEWNLLDLKQNYPNSNNHLPKPSKLNEMLDICRKLSQLNKPFIRIDLYCVNNEIYFSEFTFYSDAGFEPFTPKEWDIKLGELIDITQR